MDVSNRYIFDDSTWTGSHGAIKQGLITEFGEQNATDEKVSRAITSMVFLMNKVGTKDAFNPAYLQERSEKQKDEELFLKEMEHITLLESHLGAIGKVDRVKEVIKECWEKNIGVIAQEQNRQMETYIEESARERIAGGDEKNLATESARFCRDRFMGPILMSGGSWLINAQGQQINQESEALTRESLNQRISQREVALRQQEASQEKEKTKQQCIELYNSLSDKYQKLPQEAAACNIDYSKLQALRNEAVQLNASFQDLKVKNARLGNPVENHNKNQTPLANVVDPFNGIISQIDLKMSTYQTIGFYNSLNTQMTSAESTNNFEQLSSLENQIQQLRQKVGSLRQQSPTVAPGDVKTWVDGEIILFDKNVSTLENRLKFLKDRKSLKENPPRPQMPMFNITGPQTNTENLYVYPQYPRPLNQHDNGLMTQGLRAATPYQPQVVAYPSTYQPPQYTTTNVYQPRVVSPQELQTGVVNDVLTNRQNVAGNQKVVWPQNYNNTSKF